MGHRHTVRGGVDTFLRSRIPVRLVVVGVGTVVVVGSAFAGADGTRLAVATGGRDVGVVSGHDV